MENQSSQNQNAVSGEDKKKYFFGEKIREIREKKHLTLKFVATQAGISESLVSQIERNKVSPAIDTLLSIASVLEINLEYLFEEFTHRKHVTVIHEDERKTIYEEDISYQEISDCEITSKNLECYIITIPKGCRTHRGNYGHIGSEVGIILEGNGILRYQNKEYEIKKGDSVTFSAAAPHTLENTGASPLKALWTVTPAQKFL